MYGYVYFLLIFLYHFGFYFILFFFFALTLREHYYIYMWRITGLTDVRMWNVPKADIIVISYIEGDGHARQINVFDRIRVKEEQFFFFLETYEYNLIVFF